MFLFCNVFLKVLATQKIEIGLTWFNTIDLWYLETHNNTKQHDHTEALL